MVPWYVRWYWAVQVLVLAGVGVLSVFPVVRLVFFLAGSDRDRNYIEGLWQLGLVADGVTVYRGCLFFKQVAITSVILRRAEASWQRIPCLCVAFMHGSSAVMSVCTFLWICMLWSVLYGLFWALGHEDALWWTEGFWQLGLGLWCLLALGLACAPLGLLCAAAGYVAGYVHSTIGHDGNSDTTPAPMALVITQPGVKIHDSPPSSTDNPLSTPPPLYEACV